ncbi:hypothetical protein H4582DRAFT_1967367 [Lactarius indigo]|nr:hypothetical protein H4582DRAFT_1967367 [Lactarius indigo]
MYCTRRKGHVGCFVTLSLFIFAQLSWYMSRIGLVRAYCYLLLLMMVCVGTVMFGTRGSVLFPWAWLLAILATKFLQTLSGRVLIVVVRLFEE